MTDQEFIDWIRFWLCLDEADITDSDLQIILDTVKDQHPDGSDCQIKYYFAIATLQHLIRKQIKKSSGSTGDGALKRRREKMGRREVEIEFHGDSDSDSSWESLLEDLKADPNMIGCVVFPPSGEASIVEGGVIIGVHKNKWDMETPWRQNLNRKYRFKY